MNVHVLFLQTVSWRGVLRRPGETATMAFRDADKLTKYPSPAVKILDQAPEKVKMMPTEKPVYRIHATGRGWFEIRKGNEVINKVRGADNANMELERLVTNSK
jgi:hypothetical protein